MAIDQTITVYPKDKKNKKNGGHTAAEMKKVADDWEKKHGKPGKVSEQVSLSEFLRQGKDNNN